MLHLHRLQHRQTVAFGNALANLGVDGTDQTGHRGLNDVAVAMGCGGPR